MCTFEYEKEGYLSVGFSSSFQVKKGASIWVNCPCVMPGTLHSTFSHMGKDSFRFVFAAHIITVQDNDNDDNRMYFKVMR